MEAGEQYRFTPARDGKWTDKTIECSAAGWPKNRDRGASLLERIKSKVLDSRIANLTRRVPEANWFEMVATIGSDNKNNAPIGSGQHAEALWTCPVSGPLMFFANDAKLSALGYDLYSNNQGTISVTVERVA